MSCFEQKLISTVLKLLWILVGCLQLDAARCPKNNRPGWFSCLLTCTSIKLPFHSYNTLYEIAYIAVIFESSKFHNKIEATPSAERNWTVWVFLKEWFILPPAYVVRREGNVFTGVCISVWPQGRVGTPVSGPRSLLHPLAPVLSGGGRGYPSQVLGQGYPSPPLWPGLGYAFPRILLLIQNKNFRYFGRFIPFKLSCLHRPPDFVSARIKMSRMQLQDLLAQFLLRLHCIKIYSWILIAVSQDCCHPQFVIEFFLNNTNLTLLAFLYKLDIERFQNRQN